MGSSGTGGHASPGLGAGRLSLLLWMGLQQECDGSLRRARNDRGNLRLLALWDRDRHGQSRPAGAVEQRDERRQIGSGLLQLPLLQSR